SVLRTLRRTSRRDSATATANAATSVASAPVASAPARGLEGAQVPLARFDNQLVQRAPVADGALELPGHRIRDITHHAPAPAPGVEDVTGVLFARGARRAARAHTAALAQAQRASRYGPQCLHLHHEPASDVLRRFGHDAYVPQDTCTNQTKKIRLEGGPPSPVLLETEGGRAACPSPTLSFEEGLGR